MHGSWYPPSGVEGEFSCCIPKQDYCQENCGQERKESLVSDSAFQKASINWSRSRLSGRRRRGRLQARIFDLVWKPPICDVCRFWSYASHQQIPRCPKLRYTSRLQRARTCFSNLSKKCQSCSKITVPSNKVRDGLSEVHQLPD